MIGTVIDSLFPIVQSMGFVERYGGLVRIAKKAYPTDKGFEYKTFPVSCSVSERECWESGKYADLIPNDKYKSIAYFEPAGNVKIENTVVPGTNRKAIYVSIPVDFICWINYKISECSWYGFELLALKAFNTMSNAPLPFKVHGFKIDIRMLASRDENIFSKYSYGDKLGLLLYPYDFFKIGLTISFFIDTKCFEEITFPEPVECLSL